MFFSPVVLSFPEPGCVFGATFPLLDERLVMIDGVPESRLGVAVVYLAFGIVFSIDAPLD